MKTSIIFALAALFASPAALAQVDPQAPDQLDAVTNLSKYVRAQHQPFAEDTKVADNGREDKVFYTRSGWEDTLAFYRDAYANKHVLSGGVTCLGYFVVPSKRLANFTIMQNGKRFMLRVLDQPDGARITIYGVAWSSPQRTNKRTRRSHHRGYPVAPTRTYGL